MCVKDLFHAFAILYTLDISYQSPMMLEMSSVSGVSNAACHVIQAQKMMAVYV